MELATGIDGIDYINVYSRGKTSIGRWLSNFAYSPFQHPVYGKFNSVEGFWYWNLAEAIEERERLRNLSGYSAKCYGKGLVRVGDPDSDEFKRSVFEALTAKMNAHTKRKQEFLSTTLPLTHYYEYNGTRVVGAAQWVLDCLIYIRQMG